jgi:hypothetical protein
MTVYTGSPYVMSETTLTSDHPIIGWQNIVTASNVASVSGSAANYPVSNVANPATFLKWKAGTAGTAQIIVTTGTSNPIDYVAIAGHNFAAGVDSIQLFYDSLNSPNDAHFLMQANPPFTGSAIILRFTPISVARIYVTFIEANSPAVITPEVSVLYCGKLLVLQRRLYANHVPINEGRTWKTTNGQSESGQFLGRIVTTEYRQSKVPLSLLDPTWYRANFDPFLAQADEHPFFWAWRPNTYPDEVGYAWLANQPAPAPAPPSNLIALELDVTGIA